MEIFCYKLLFFFVAPMVTEIRVKFPSPLLWNIFSARVAGMLKLMARWCDKKRNLFAVLWKIHSGVRVPVGNSKIVAF